MIEDASQESNTGRRASDRSGPLGTRQLGAKSEGVSPQEAIQQSLAGVGARLRNLRQEQGCTLEEVADLVGMSLSTLSRLESGKRKPSLELLLPLAGIYGLPLDELVGAPPIGDPRIHITPQKINGQTVLPLSRGSIGVQAFKYIVDGKQMPKLGALKTHPGFEWVYVIRGRLSLIMGDKSMTLDAGEAAEFDTHTPQWFGSAEASGVEYLSLFGPEGQRVHLRK
ncbi:XRE family transcriptional regulator [Brevibacterium antiquum]|uniref:helix-turn-helix domain-containing protein n=1 Tax=Brevibacterium antiquum TaxID=234835 RepID=UPI0018DFB976|nr:helix-turn-helix transcriptional regulator [Brevibacterium antiquum]